MTNWKTTVCGAIAALGAYFANQPDGNLKIVGQILTAIGTAGIGYFAKDASGKQ